MLCESSRGGVEKMRMFMSERKIKAQRESVLCVRPARPSIYIYKLMFSCMYLVPIYQTYVLCGYKLAMAARTRLATTESLKVKTFTIMVDQFWVFSFCFLNRFDNTR